MIYILWLRIASFESIRLNIEDIEPIVNEKNHTPKTINPIQHTLSKLVLPLISPYPTVDSVAYVQYSDVTYL